MTNKSERIVILGVGNVLLTDEGVGVKVVKELERRYDFPSNVKLVDGGTQGLWLMSTIQQADHLIVVDAVLGKGEPGTIYRLERDDLPKGLRMKTSAHDSDLLEALALCALIDSEPSSCVVIGIQPANITDFGTELTDVIAGKVDDLIARVIGELKALGAEAQKKN
ncbi:MAG: HyaD/HybD family hydrogenase maturation endopeptidase [Desulfomonile sp.]|nr:HyaD/HybD family hydrogenase maturation endopeptidase [Desulfomonile sp.]